MTGARPHVLVVDDDTEVRAMLRRVLLADGFAVDTSRDADEGIRLAADRRPDVVVMDIGLPGMDGIEAVRHLRANGVQAPVLMLTAHGGIDSRIDSFTAGADDFLAKPFHNEELTLRLRALVRRTTTTTQDGDDRLRRGDTIVDTAARRCWRGEREVLLTPREFDLLEYLVRNAGTVLHRDRIADVVWHGETTQDANVVDVYVGYLRRKLEEGGEPRAIRTVRGHGFTFDANGGST